MVGSVPTPRGTFPPKQSSKPPKLKHYNVVEFLSIFSVEPPRTNLKPPYWKLSGDGSGFVAILYSFSMRLLVLPASTLRKHIVKMQKWPRRLPFMFVFGPFRWWRKTEKATIFKQTALLGKVVQYSSGNCFSTNKLVFNNTHNSIIPDRLLNIFLHFNSSKNKPKMKNNYRSPMHFDRQNAQLGTKHGAHCRLTMGLMIGTTCLYTNFGHGWAVPPKYFCTPQIVVHPRKFVFNI